MNKYFSAVILVVFFGINLFSQNMENEPNISEIRKNNYQVELGFKSISNIYHSTASATIMFKKKHNAGELIDVKAINFLRAYLTLSSNIAFNKDSLRQIGFDRLGSYPYIKPRVDLTLGLGIEKQFQNRRFVHYYGCDVFIDYYDGGEIISYYYSRPVVNYSVLYQHEKTIDAGFIPFFGLKYYVTDQLSFGLETGFSLSYYYSKYSDVDYSFEIVNGKEVFNQTNFTPYTEQGIKFNFLGIRFITVGYTFK